jgi:hypothetical protein
MTSTAAGLLAAMREEFLPGPEDNRLVPLVAQGQAPLGVIGALAAEQHRIVPSDRRSFLTLAARAGTTPAGDFFADLAGAENAALAALPALAAGGGMDQAAVAGYRPLPGCQAYPAYVAWLALNADPDDVLLALVANFTAFGQYCRTLAAALREKYGLADEACAFFDLFAPTGPERDDPHALAVAQAAVDSGRPLDPAREQARLLQSYELMFWNALADTAG